MNVNHNNNPERPDAAYHRSIVKDVQSDKERRIAAMRTLKGKEFDSTLNETALQEFIAVYEQESDEGVKDELMSLLLTHWPQDPWVVERVRAEVAAGKYTIPRNLFGIGSFESCSLIDTEEYGDILAQLWRKLDDANNSPEEVITLLACALRAIGWKMTKPQPERYLRAQLDFMNQVITGEMKHADIEKGGALQGWDVDAWKKTLRAVQETFAGNEAVQSLSAKLALCFGVSPKRDHVQAILAQMAEKKRRFEHPGENAKHILTETDKKTLAAEIRESNLAPSALFEELFDNGKSAIFVESDYTSWPLLARVIRSLRKNGTLEGVVINMPEHRREEFEEAIRSGDLSAFHNMFSRYDKDTWKAITRPLQDIFALPDLAVHFLQGKYHQYPNPYNELELDEQLKKLSAVRGNVLVLNLPPWSFHNTKKCDVALDDGTRDPSIAKRLAEVRGTNAVGSVGIWETYRDLDGQMNSKESVGDFCEDHGFARPFAIRVENTILREIPHSDLYPGLTNGQALDGIVVNVESDEDSDAEEEAPDPSRHEPTPSGTPLVHA
jgi:hypothetical protein